MESNLEAWCIRCNLLQGPRSERDTRVQPRDWQALALPQVVERIANSQVATVAAAPGAGKTVFASFVFEALAAMGVVERMVVLAPRKTLVSQWHNSLVRARHIELGPGLSHERSGQDGVVVTYQSLLGQARGVHALRASEMPTLFVLDEVHHLGEPTNSAWAREVTDLVGDVRAEIKVAGVLNLSGTLWRSRAAERISTVRYVDDQHADGKLISDVDYRIEAETLIANGELRPVDLFRRGATVDIVDLAETTRTVSAIADLDEEAKGRVAVRELPRDEEWRRWFVEAVLDRLVRRHRDFKSGPVKALIVASRQEDAKAFQATANAVMLERRMQPIADLAVSDEGNAQQVLEDFKKRQAPGVLCTVDMAGEGYDCPEIVVVGFATNKLTPLYVRQVVARAQRVTAFERETLRRPIPAAIVIPDVPVIVNQMSAILEPMRHEIEIDVEPKEPTGTGDGPFANGPRYMLDAVDGHTEGDAHVTGEADGDIGMDLVRSIEPEARRVGLPEADAPRIAIAVRAALTTRREQRPFDPLSPEDEEMERKLRPEQTSSTGPRVEKLSVEERAQAARKELNHYSKWWVHNGDSEVQTFNFEVNEAGGIGKGGRPGADVEQLEKALAHAKQRVSVRCHESGKKMPRFDPKKK